MGCCGNKTNYRITIGQIKNLAKTATEVAKEVIKSGEVRVTKDLSDRRMKVCEQCHELQGSRCSRCGCFITVKIQLKVSKCPLGKW